MVAGVVGSGLALHNHPLRLGTLAPTAGTPAEGPGFGSILLQVNAAGGVTWRAQWESGESGQRHAPTLFTVHGVGKPFTPTAQGAKGSYVDAGFDDVGGEDKASTR